MVLLLVQIVFGVGCTENTANREEPWPLTPGEKMFPEKFTITLPGIMRPPDTRHPTASDKSG